MSGSRRDSPSSGFGATREEFAAGDVLIRFPVAEIPRLLIVSPIAKPGWRGRTEGGATRAMFPGSAIHFENRFWEVRRILRQERDGGGLRYELWPWEDRFVLRETFEYSRAEAERVAAHVRSVRRQQATAHTLAWALPFVGLLPARLQIAIEEEYGLPAARATFWSALILLGLGVLAVLTGAQCAAAQLLGGPKPGPVSLLALRLLPLTAYLTVESLVRYRLSFPAGIALGSAPVALPIGLALALRDALRSTAGTAPRPDATSAAGQPAAARPSRTRRGWTVFADDEVRELAENRLEILSLLDKPHWGPRTAIRYRDTWWALAERTPPGADGAERFRFVLEPWPEHLLVQDPAEYAPAEVRGLAYDAARDRRRPTLESLSVLFGLLPPPEQERLADVYGYDPRSRTGWSIVAVAGWAAFAALVTAARLISHTAGLAEALIAIVAVALLLECGVRAVAWQAGALRASVLAPFVRPLAAHLLDLPPER